MRLTLALLVALSACAPQATSAPSAPVPATSTGDAGRTLPNDIHWFRNAVEYRALALQVYRAASEHVRREAAALERGRWAVILDADETVLDNSEYQVRNALRGERYDTATWNPWVREERARAVPGAVAFARLVRQLGGRIAIVTNRDEGICAPTMRNLRALAIEADVVLCRQPGASDKNPRFRAVAEGTTPAGLPPLRVVAWVGDNILDFPALDPQAPESALAAFGERYFILPNPMYGSWESLPRR